MVHGAFVCAVPIMIPSRAKEPLCENSQLLCHQPGSLEKHELLVDCDMIQLNDKEVLEWIGSLVSPTRHKRNDFEAMLLRSSHSKEALPPRALLEDNCGDNSRFIYVRTSY